MLPRAIRGISQTIATEARRTRTSILDLLFRINFQHSQCHRHSTQHSTLFQQTCRRIVLRHFLLIQPRTGARHVEVSIRPQRNFQQHRAQFQGCTRIVGMCRRNRAALPPNTFSLVKTLRTNARPRHPQPDTQQRR